MDLLIQIDKGNLKPLSPGMQSKINITLFQICFRALLDTPDPTCIEATAYQILILCKARGLPILRSIRAELNHEITSQASFLSGTHRSESDSIANNVWIEKVSFGSPLLTQSYKLAAIKAASSCTDEVPLGSPSIPISSSENDANYVRLLKKTPLFESTPEWQVRASMLEASLFQPLLRDRRLNIFPRKDMAPDRYFDLIPLTWISCNNRTKVFASNRFIFDMMIISFLDFQADEFMEAVAGPSYKGGMDHLHQLIDDICDTIESNSSAKRNNKRRKNSDKNSSESSEAERNELSTFDSVSPNGSFHKSNGHKSQRGQDEVREILSRFVLHIVHHPSVRSASHWNRTATLRELRIYLHAHATQSADNARLALARKAVWKLEEAKTSLTSRIQGQYSDSYFRWVRTTSGDHTACPYSFAFAGCLLSTQLNGIETFPTTKAKYLASAACQHLATMCRMYNDYGSIARDRVECNLNSLDFAEFASDNDAKTSGKTGTQEEIVEEHCDASLMQAKKKTLYELAQYERSWLSDVMRRLRDEMQGSQKRRQLDIWNMFCDVTDLYGQIYVVKDIASRMKGT